jgi:hypothetical protein
LRKAFETLARPNDFLTQSSIQDFLTEASVILATDFENAREVFVAPHPLQGSEYDEG